MSALIGFGMIFAFVAALFGVLVWSGGWRAALSIFVITLALVGYLVLASKLIIGGMP